MSQRPQQLMRPLLVINIVSHSAADTLQPAKLSLSECISATGPSMLLFAHVVHYRPCGCALSCGGLLDNAHRQVLLSRMLCMLPCLLYCQDVKDNHEEAAKVAPQTLQLCRMVS